MTAKNAMRTFEPVAGNGRRSMRGITLAKLLACACILLVHAAGLFLAEPVAAQTARRTAAPRAVAANPTCDCSSCQMAHATEYEPICSPRSRCVNFWVGAEYLHWWPNSGRSVPLATTSDAGTAAASSGILGLSTTSVLADARDLNDALGGFKLQGGFSNVLGCYAVDWSYFNIDNDTSETYGGVGTIVARPYTNIASGNPVQAALLVSHPSFLNGQLQIHSSTEMQGVEVGTHWTACSGPNMRLQWLAGYRYLSLDDALSLDSFSLFTAAQGQILAGTTKSISDAFSAENTFHGGQLGLAYRERLGCWDVDVQTKLGLGGTRIRRQIAGSTTNVVPAGGGSASFVGGLLAQSSNIGVTEQNHFSLVPELRVGLSRQVTSRLRGSVGYNLLAWTNTARAADLIDPVVSQLPPQNIQAAQRPGVGDARDTFLIQGINLGLSYEF